jgi:hypothetical protein
MAEDSFVGKKVTVRFEVVNTAAWEGVVVADDEKGITLRRPYRKGVRLERIPREQIRGVFQEIEKGPRRLKGAKGSAALEPDETEDFDDNDGLDDDGLPDTEWEEDDE